MEPTPEVIKEPEIIYWMPLYPAVMGPKANFTLPDDLLQWENQRRLALARTLDKVAFNKLKTLRFSYRPIS